MTHTIFYSWQSDLPNSTNRTFIERAVQEAIKRLGQDASLTPAMRGRDVKIDKDTQGVSGSPPIVEVIFDKIAKSAVFVPDLTFVATSQKGRLVPNPNVLIEYGWALRALSHSRIVPIMNSYYGEPSWETLPFDMRHLRHPFAYRLEPNPSTSEKEEAKEALVSHLTASLRLIFETGVLDSDPAISPIDIVKEYILDDKQRIKLHDIMHEETTKTLKAIDQDDLLKVPGHYDPSEFRRRARKFEAETAALRQLLATACYWDSTDNSDLWIEVVRRFDGIRRRQSGLTVFINLQRYPAFLVFQTSAFAAFAGNNLQTFGRLMTEGDYESSGLPTGPAETFFPSEALGSGAFDELREAPQEGHRWKTPGSLQLRDVMRQATKVVIPDEYRFEETFDRFEYLCRLILADILLTQGKSVFAPHGIFVWRKESDQPGNVFSYFEHQAAANGADWPLLKSGLFGKSLDRFTEAKAAIDPGLKRGWTAHI